VTVEINKSEFANRSRDCAAWAAHRRKMKGPFLLRGTALRMGPLVRVPGRVPFGHSTREGADAPTVELPPTLSKVFGSLATHPRLLLVKEGFGDDTLDGETFFWSAHHCEWAGGARFEPFQVTHVPSGLKLGRYYAKRAEVEAVAAKLATHAGIDWELIDLAWNSDEARFALLALQDVMRGMGAL
jgi:hypothetical protein